MRPLFLSLLIAVVVGHVGACSTQADEREWNNEAVVERLKTTPNWAAVIITLPAGTKVASDGINSFKPQEERRAHIINGWVRRELMFVGGTDESIVPPLVEMLDAKNEFRLRCRAMFGLVRRGHPAGLKEARRMMHSERETDRSAAWDALSDAPDLAAITKTISPAEMLMLYHAEKSKSVRLEIEELFARKKAKFALAEMCMAATSKEYLDPNDLIIERIAEIGDPTRAEAIEKSWAEVNNKIDALSKLRSPASAEFLSMNLAAPRAAIALARCAGRDAIPELKRVEAGLRLHDHPGGAEAAKKELQHNRDHFRIALILAESADPRRELTKLATDAGSSEELRDLALEQLQDLGCGDALPEFLVYYRLRMETRGGFSLVYVLENDHSAAATEALKEHYVKLQRRDADVRSSNANLSTKERLIFGDAAFSLLHKRIGNEAFKL